MDFFAKLRKFARVRYSFIIAIIGLFFLAGAGFAFWATSQQQDWVSTTATITKIEQVNDEEMQVTVTFTDANGVSHTELLGSYSSGMKEGQSVDIKYDPADPSKLSGTSNNWLVFVLLGVGAAAFVGGSISTVIALKKPSAEYNDFDKVDPSTYTEQMVQEVKDSDEEEKEYIYHLANKAGYNHVMETKDQKRVFEANCDKIGIVSHNKYTFINHLTMHKEEMDVSHTVTNSAEGENVGMDLSYHFNVNGENCWDHLGKMGYSLDPHLEGLTKVVYDVKKYGVKVATIAMAGTNDVPGAKQYPWGNAPTNYALKVVCRDSDLDGVAFACFCIAKR